MTEILAPAGDVKCAQAAIDAGADAIYLGLSGFSARSSAANFALDELKNLVLRAHLFGVKIYVAMNTLVKDGELEDFVTTAVAAWNTGIDAIIIQDIYLGAYLKREYPQMCLHLSTQAGVCNALGAQYALDNGFSRVILARETKLEDIREIAKIIETEVFVQGALCTCFSGQCYLSSFAGGNSGNRGKCKQPCRKRYKIDRQGYDELAYRISLSDLSVGENIEKLIDAGVTSFKIEGRMRRPEYVAAAVGYYKKLIAGSAGESDVSALKRTYNRGNYTAGLAFGQDKSLISSSVQGHIGEYVGTVQVLSGKYFCRTNAAFSEGDGFKILRDGCEVGGAAFGEKCRGGFNLKSSVRLRSGDKVFITTDKKLNEKLLATARRLDIKISAKFRIGQQPEVTVNGSRFVGDFNVERAVKIPTLPQDVIACFNKIDTNPFNVTFGEVDVEHGAFVPASALNAFRRKVYAEFLGGFSPTGRAIIAKPLPQSGIKTHKNNAVAVVAGNLNEVTADIGILKPSAYEEGIFSLCNGFAGLKYLYLPPYLSGEEIERIKPLIKLFDGIYCGGNYSVLLAEELKKPLFAGLGFNIFNRIALENCPAEYVALSKELTQAEAKSLAKENTFYLTAGGVKVMDLIYCPFSKSCKACDKRDFYTLTDENGRAFPMKRYSVPECRFELYNCANLVSENSFTGKLFDFSVQQNAAGLSENLSYEKLKNSFINRTSGHTQNGVL